MKTFTAFVLPDTGGTVVVHDRYQNYDAIPGLIHQLCPAHPARPGRRRRDLPRRVLAGPGQPSPARAHPRREHRPRHPAVTCSNACVTGRTMCSASRVTCGSRPHPTKPNATCGPPKPSRRYRAGPARSRPLATGTPFAATSPPPPSTAPMSWPPSTTPSPATHGCTNGNGDDRCRVSWRPARREPGVMAGPGAPPLLRNEPGRHLTPGELSCPSGRSARRWCPMPNELMIAPLSGSIT